MKHVWILIATFFKVGYIPFAPGTAASLVTTALAYFIAPYWQAPLIIKLAVILAIFLLGIPAARESEKHFKKKDPRQCVIDEVPGQMLSLLLIPHDPWYYFAGFVLFRVFDILKPYPIKKLEKAPHGIGIMIDDIAAGLFGLGALHLGIYLLKTMGWL